jgi:hypothetical protein
MTQASQQTHTTIKRQIFLRLKSTTTNEEAIDAPPSSLLDPKMVQLCQRVKIVGTWCRSQLPALKGVRRAC